MANNRPLFISTSLANREKARSQIYEGLMAISLAFVIFCLVLNLIGERAFDEAGQITDGTVIKKERRGGRYGYRYKLIYQYQIGDQNFEGSGYVSKEVFENTSFEQPISIEYLSGNPGTARLAGSGGFASKNVWVGLICCSFPLGFLGVVLFHRGWRLRSRIQRSRLHYVPYTPSPTKKKGLPQQSLPKEHYFREE